MWNVTGIDRHSGPGRRAYTTLSRRNNRRDAEDAEDLNGSRLRPRRFRGSICGLLARPCFRKNSYAPTLPAHLGRARIKFLKSMTSDGFRPNMIIKFNYNLLIYKDMRLPCRSAGRLDAILSMGKD